MKKILRIINLLVYYCFVQFLPDNYFPFFGKISKYVRNRCCRLFCYHIDKTAQIQKKVYLGNGSKIQVGSHSGIGAFSKNQNTKLTIGNDVMIGEYMSVLGGGDILQKNWIYQ